MNAKSILTTVSRVLLSACSAFAIVALTAAPAGADEFALFKGKAAAIWKTTIIMGGAIRTTNTQPDLVGAGAGRPSAITGMGTEIPGASGAVGVNDDSNLNFHRGEFIGAPVFLVSDFRLQTASQGFFIRVRAWYDMGLEAKNVHHGNAANAFVPNQQFNDANFEGAARLRGIDIYDAFYFGNADIGRSKLQLRVGRQVVSWGEGLLYPGINAFNAADPSWLAKPGAMVLDGGLLPVARVYADLTFPHGWNVSGFYNLEFRNTNMIGCGQWGSLLDNFNQPGCSLMTPAFESDGASAVLKLVPSYYAGKLPAGGAFPDGLPDNPNASGKPSWQDSGWGLSAHQFLRALKSELGLYYAHYTNPNPTYTILPGSNPTKLAGNTYWVTGIQAYAVSLSTGVRNVALSGQVTRILDFPAQRNFPHLIQGANEGIGPYADAITYDGRQYLGYMKANVTQAQFGGTVQIGPLLRLSNALLIAETNMQWMTDFPGYEQERLGRFGNFGIATWNGGNCSPEAAATGVKNKCDIDGFQSPFAMGYRLRFVAPLPASRRGVTVTPTLSLDNGIKGFSTDGQIVGGRVAWGAWLRVDLRQRYFVDLGVSGYRSNAAWDPMRDRGLFSLDFGINLQ